MAYAAVISLKKTIENLLDSPRTYVPPSSQVIESASTQLESLQQMLKQLDGSSKSRSRKQVNAVDAQIKEAVWEFHDLLENHVYTQVIPPSEIGQTLRLKVELHELGQDLDSFVEMLEQMEEEYSYVLDNPSPEEGEEDEEETVSGGKQMKMIGLGASELSTSIRIEMNSGWGFSVIPVVGMAGIGKTCLAKELFDESLLDFEFRAWVKIGRKCKLDRLKRDILIKLDPDMDRELGEGGEGRCLKQFLEAKRCLVVLDDVWDEDVWDHLKTSLPKHGDGASKLLLVTRLRHLAEYDSYHYPGPIYTVELLNEDESWDLLRRMVFGEKAEEEEEEDCCPPQLIKAGKKIAKKCDGLPLMILAVARLLSTADDQSAEYWEEVAETKNHPIFMSAYDQLYEVLHPSYEYLPQHLKPCFLHMGVFPQGSEISKSKLSSMWIAEGFLEPDSRDTLEQCFQRSLGELSDHSVVIKCQEISDTNSYKAPLEIKTCRLQSCFWHLCNREATSGKFSRVLSSLVECLEESTKGQRRLSFHNNILFAIKDVSESLQEAYTTAHSLFCYGPYYPFQVPLRFDFLRLLKVLDALQIRFYEFPSQVSELVYLRYLALTYGGELSSSVSRLWNLQFLIIHRNVTIKYSGVVSYMPKEIWDMKELKHIEIMGSNLPNPSAADACLENLSRLVGVGPETCTREVLERVPNLRKLGIQIEWCPDDDMRAFHCLDHIHVLHELTSLKCVVANPMLRRKANALPSPPQPKLPSSLEKLHLSGLGYPWEYMDLFGELPSIESLKLRQHAFRGPKREMKVGTLPMLKHLLIEDTDLVQLKLEGFFHLQVVRLKHCYSLKDLQWKNRHRTIPEIELIDCSPATAECAKEIVLRGAATNENNFREFCRDLIHSSCSW